MCVEKISIDEFVRISQRKISTIRKNHAHIPGLKFHEGKYDILKGTRYPCDLHRYKIKDSADRRYLLLKAISEYEYIDHVKLKIYHEQFIDLIKELLDAGLIRENHLHNHYGANAYDCTALGDALLKKRKYEAIKEITEIVASAAGSFVGNVISEVA